MEWRKIGNLEILLEWKLTGTANFISDNFKHGHVFLSHTSELANKPSLHEIKWAALWMTKSICFFAMGGWYLIAVHLLIVTKLTIVHAIVIEEFILFPRNLLHCWLLSILPFFSTGKDGWLEASSGSLYASDALPPASLASIPCLYVLYWIYVERENFQHKKM